MLAYMYVNCSHISIYTGQNYNVHISNASKFIPDLRALIQILNIIQGKGVLRNDSDVTPDCLIFERFCHQTQVTY